MSVLLTVKIVTQPSTEQLLTEQDEKPKISVMWPSVLLTRTAVDVTAAQQQQQQQQRWSGLANVHTCWSAIHGADQLTS